MENFDLIIFTSILVGFFILFGIGTYREFRDMEQNSFDPNGEDGGAKTFWVTIGSFFSQSKYQKK